MTLESHGQGQDEAPPPPATTRWQGERPEDEDVLLPPYVSGRDRAAASENLSGAGQHQEPAESKTGRPAHSLEQAQPLESFEPESVEPEPVADSSSYDFPWESGGFGGEDDATEGVPSGEDAAGEKSESAAVGEGQEAEPWSTYEPDRGEDSSSDEFPFDAFDLEGDWREGEGQGEVGEAETDAPEPATEALEIAGAGFAATEAAAGRAPDHSALADRVEGLADVLRRAGREGVEREMASRDRLTSLMAGVLAGYLAGLED